MAAERRFDTMGTTAHVVVVADSPGREDTLLDAAHARLGNLEARWSRFRPDSEVNRCNAAGGAPVVVSRETRLLVERAITGWERTGGRFDPTVLPALVAAGYDRSFSELGAGSHVEVTGGSPTPGCAGIMVDHVVGAVRLPPDVGFDAGGIGKGFAADLVTAELLEAGATGVCTNLGGDLRVDGDGPDGAGWMIELEHPLDADASLGLVHLARGAVASTWRTKRQWGDPDAPRHHLIDPDSGECASSGLAGVCVITSSGWWAEVLAKAAFLAGPSANGSGGAALLASNGAAGILVDDAGHVTDAGPIDRFRP